MNLTKEEQETIKQIIKEHGDMVDAIKVLISTATDQARIGLNTLDKSAIKGQEILLKHFQ